MNYKCTRNNNVTISAAQAIVQGISKDGGLFVPEKFPHYSYSDLCELQESVYVDRAARILSDFLSEFTADEISSCVTQAYAPEKFSGENPAPVVLLQNGEVDMHVLELWHGPTCAFKDMALQLLPHLLTKSLQKTNCKKTALILVATSGDTGKAALEGFKDVDGTKILVFYPENGVSPMQKRQMNTQEGKNVAVCAIEGNFDDAQTGVKKIFVNDEINHALSQNNMQFSSANSINWGRLLPQIVYYFSSYCDLMASGEIEHEGEKVNIVVPTGNFGNILAAYYAMKMGLPVNKLICASNSNNVLTEFLKTGVYDRNRPFYTTLSPSMDILVSSNLERLLYDLTGGNAEKVSGWMNELNTTGRYQVDSDVLDSLQKLFYSGCCDDAKTKATINEVEQTEKYLCDTHTAVAVQVYQEYVKNTLDKETPTIVVSTASPYKFADSVLSAITDNYDASEDEFAKISELSALTGTKIPQPIADLEEKPVRFQNMCSADKMGETVLKLIR
ncbi:MAG TPA: threonine synthase [Oscillospiraceae bacterium]|nr:threonine synthase [Oscillospiraceae bacterium]